MKSAVLCFCELGPGSPPPQTWQGQAVGTLAEQEEWEFVPAEHVAGEQGSHLGAWQRRSSEPQRHVSAAFLKQPGWLLSRRQGRVDSVCPGHCAFTSADIFRW